jgi:spore coat polysaccharide biosynthesis protein SpsF (cytidylyltransferase family)
VQVFRGANEDVLDRYYHCAKEQHADVIVRITADDVLVDPVITDQIIDEFVNSKEKYDYVSNTVIPSFPEGISIEVFSFMALETAWKNAVKRSEREHVTPYFYTNPDRFRIRHVIHKEDLSSLRWTLDYPSDLEFMRQVYSRLYTAGDKGMLMEDVLSLLKREPELIRLTEGIPRNEGYKKSLVEDTQSKKA